MMSAIAKTEYNTGSQQLRLNNTPAKGMRKGQMAHWWERNEGRSVAKIGPQKSVGPTRVKGKLSGAVGKRRNLRRQIRKWKSQSREAQPQIVVVGGRRMRCIIKADGRKIYRLPRKFQDVQGWKLRQQKKAKVRKSDKSRVAFRNMVRARNDLELRTLRKRRSYLRHKRLADYIRGKLATNRQSSYRMHKQNVVLDSKLDIGSHRVAPGASLRKVRSLAVQGPFSRTTNPGRGTLRKRQIIRGYTPNDPWTTVGPQTELGFEKRKRYAKVRSTRSPKLVGVRIEKLLSKRKSNAIYSKSPLASLSNDRLIRGWRHGWKVR